jgi:general secretion pathway protein C
MSDQDENSQSAGGTSTQLIDPNLPPLPDLGEPERRPGLFARLRQKFAGSRERRHGGDETIAAPDQESTLTRFRDLTRSLVIEGRDRMRGGTPGLRPGALREVTRKLDPAAVGEWFQARLQKRGASFWGKLAVVILCTWFLADLTAWLAGSQIPAPPPARVGGGGLQARAKSLADYDAIVSRNLFNRKGLIPGEETKSLNPTNEPVKSNLPLNLIGTVILRDELRSIATIEDKTASIVYPVQVDDVIPQKIRVRKVLADRVIFVNAASGQLEYIELPAESESNPRISVGARPSGGPGIEAVSPTQYNVSRAEVDKTLQNLNQVITQARCVPNFEGGLPAGYKCFQIVPGSIYDKLGMKNGDVLCGLNGESINDPGKAFEMLNALRTSSHIELCIKRDGKTQNFAYDIR